MFDQFPENIYNLLNSNAGFLSGSYYTYHYMSQNVANFFWEFNAQKKRASDNRFNVNEMNKVPQPLGERSVESLQSFLRTKILPDNFYDYSTVSDFLFNVLSKSKYYESYYDRFQRQFKAKRIVTIPPQPNIENNINSLVSKIQLFKPEFNKDKIVFQEFDSDEQYYCDSNAQKYYFSSLLFQNPQKLEDFVFRKCLSMLGIGVDSLLQRFRIVPI